jgi:hypothetical protein
MSSIESIAMMIKVEQLGLFKESLKLSYRETSELFDQYEVWSFLDDIYEGAHMQGSAATFEDVKQHLQTRNGALFQ